MVFIRLLFFRCYGIGGGGEEDLKGFGAGESHLSQHSEDGDEEGEEEEEGEGGEGGEDLKVDPESLARQEKEDEELDAAMDEEDEEEEDRADELKALQEDADLPLEELIKRYLRGRFCSPSQFTLPSSFSFSLSFVDDSRSEIPDGIVISPYQSGRRKVYFFVSSRCPQRRPTSAGQSRAAFCEREKESLLSFSLPPPS